MLGFGIAAHYDIRSDRSCRRPISTNLRTFSLPRAERPACRDLNLPISNCWPRSTRWLPSCRLGPRSPDWPPARHCQMLVKRLTARAETLRVRLEAPLVVATLGGTGTGKSSLVNALVGSVVTAPGRQRPTTRQPVLICRPEITPAMLGIDPAAVQLVQIDTPALHDLVLLDCPDPDTTEDTAALKATRPGCANCCRIATCCWWPRRSRNIVARWSAPNWPQRPWVPGWSSCKHTPTSMTIFATTGGNRSRANTPRAKSSGRFTGCFARCGSGLATARRVRPAGRLCSRTNWLEPQGTGSAGRISSTCCKRLWLPAASGSMPNCRPSGSSIRRLPSSVRGWPRGWRPNCAKNFCTVTGPGKTGCWMKWRRSGVSARFRVCCAAYQGLGGIVSGAALFRVRSSAQLALWGLWEGGRQLRSRGAAAAGRSSRRASLAIPWRRQRTAHGRDHHRWLRRRGWLAARRGPVAGDRARSRGRGQPVRGSCRRRGAIIDHAPSTRHTGWFTRWSYELLLAFMLGMLVYRYARNFFFDSWLGPELGLFRKPNHCWASIS